MGNAILIIPLILAEDECLLASKSRCGEKKSSWVGDSGKKLLGGLGYWNRRTFCVWPN